jgi:hypothetical protein
MTNLEALIDAATKTGPATIEEIAQKASVDHGLNYESVRKRKAEAVEAGKLEVVGYRGSKEVLQVCKENITQELIVDAELDQEQRRELIRLESEIEWAAKSFVHIGAALQKIRDGKLYRETDGTFEEYCKNRWQMGRNLCYKLIAASEVFSVLCTIVHKPMTETQCRPLAKLKNPDGTLDRVLITTVFQSALQKATVVDGQPRLTAKLIEDEVKSHLKVDELADAGEDEFDQAEQMSVEDACKAARRCKSITPEYLAKRTGIKEIKIKHWLELSSDFVGQYGEKLEDGTWRLKKVFVLTDAQLERRTKSVSILGDQSPTESFSHSVYEIENRLQAIQDTFGDQGRYSAMWKNLNPEDKRSLKSVLKRTQAKLNEILPRILERLSDE